MIKIFNATETNFASAGEIIISPLKCIETKRKSLNGWYIEVEISINFKEYIQKDKLCVIKSKSKENLQAFRIAENIEYTAKRIKFIAEHVMFDSRKCFLLDVRPTNLNGINALNYINDRTDIISPFSIFSNVENVNTSYFIRKNLLEAWTIIEEKWNGVFEADNWNIEFLTEVGNDNGEEIIYGKNLQGFNIFEDWTNVCTKLYPVGYDGLMLPEKFIESDIKYYVPYTKTLDFQTKLEQEEQTKENLTNELRINAENYIEENKYPKVSYTINSNINDEMQIGDTIRVKHPLVSIPTEVLEYQYNVISKKVISLTFGNYDRDVKTKFDNIKDTINKIVDNISKQEVVINTQTNLINSLNKNGYVYIDDNEILILDKLPKEEAKNVWRFGLGGIGFSSNGYEGPFETAMTQDGQINAKFITTGTMSVDRIEGLGEQLTLIVTKTENINSNNQKITNEIANIKEESNKTSGDINSIQKDIETLKLSTEGLENSLQTQGGSNLLLNSSGLFGNEYWEGNVQSITNTEIQNNFIAKDCFNLQNGIIEQTIKVTNGSYYIGFKYKKLLELASCSIRINDEIYELDSLEIKEEDIYIDVSEHSITIELISDTDNACLIGDIIVVQGPKQSWSSNMNEIYTSTVKIGIGLEITSSTMKTRLLANADGVRIVNINNGQTVAEFTDVGMRTEEIESKKGQIAGLLIQNVNGQVWLSNINGGGMYGR